jgi:hypothetical protein
MSILLSVFGAWLIFNLAVLAALQFKPLRARVFRRSPHYGSMASPLPAVAPAVRNFTAAQPLTPSYCGRGIAMLELFIVLGTPFVLGFSVGWACRALASKRRRRLEQQYYFQPPSPNRR